MKFLLEKKMYLLLKFNAKNIGFDDLISKLNGDCLLIRMKSHIKKEASLYFMRFASFKK